MPNKTTGARVDHVETIKLVGAAINALCRRKAQQAEPGIILSSASLGRAQIRCRDSIRWAGTLPRLALAVTAAGWVM